MTPRKAEEDFKIPKSVLHRHIKLGKNIKKHGGQTVLFSGEEKILVQRLVLCASWGYPMDSYDVRLIVKGYMDRRGVDVKRFKGNMPGVDWAESFLMRHKDNLRERISQNINRAQATVSQPTINSYFNNLAESLDGTHAPNIVNYDEINLTDDPERKEVITKRGTKYPEISTSKVSTSLIYAAAADGILIPPYIVYKAVNLYDTWTFGGPNGARYNRTLVVNLSDLKISSYVLKIRKAVEDFCEDISFTIKRNKGSQRSESQFFFKIHDIPDSAVD
ncbi:Hypothetical predicted protein [Octopus vulgaris]|uniref:Uncharacterized protein n=1 Tax=Octopus vulgaris TaxID=6645 RepID=A0AA36AKZ7_OCTVU|nr:Hypothetical predicted protein [Octopus vulgaris]